MKDSQGFLKGVSIDSSVLPRCGSTPAPGHILQCCWQVVWFSFFFWICSFSVGGLEKKSATHTHTCGQRESKHNLFATMATVATHPRSPWPALARRRGAPAGLRSRAAARAEAERQRQLLRQKAARGLGASMPLGAVSAVVLDPTKPINPAIPTKPTSQATKPSNQAKQPSQATKQPSNPAKQSSQAIQAKQPSQASNPAKQSNQATIPLEYLELLGHYFSEKRIAGRIVA